jgi:transcription-repair coupling factor (superfamily II helicase)
MTDFVAGRYNVLVCTTIIESGLDIPNCNTLIIEGADRFGLSQLYQLRGRVGRFKHQAYAYLLLHRHTRLLDADARQRMNTLRQHTQLGAGFRIAMRDLELRGRRQPARPEQSGHIVGVGFELYCQLLRQSVARLKGEKTAAAIRANVKLDFVFVGEGGPGRGSPRGATRTATRPQGRRGRRRRAGDRPDPGPDPRRLHRRDPPRIDLYRRLAMADSVRGRAPDRGRARDRFGKPGPEVRTLLLVTEIRVLAEQKGILSVESESNRLKCLAAAANGTTG